MSVYLYDLIYCMNKKEMSVIDFYKYKLLSFLISDKGGIFMVLKRNIALSIILSIITCGVYGFYWLAVMAEDLNTASSEQDTSGGLVVVFTLLTCGIYGWYWLYRAGQKIEVAQGNRNFPYVSNQSIAYIILGVFNLSIVAYALIQNELNKIAEFDSQKHL